MPILKDSQPPPPCDVLIIESTYGDRTHDEHIKSMRTKAKEVIKHALEHKSKIIRPRLRRGPNPRDRHAN